jgi:hypothetical protein
MCEQLKINDIVGEIYRKKWGDQVDRMGEES